MARTVEVQGTPRTDQRFVAEAVTETGVTLSGSSEWQPSHWDRERMAQEAVRELRTKFKQADLLNVKVGRIKVFRETRRIETVTTTWTKREFYGETKR